MEPPSSTDRFGPASASGRLFRPVTFTFSMCQLSPFSNTRGPDAVTLTVYVDCVATEVMFSMLPSVIPKRSESPPMPIPYTGL